MRSTRCVRALDNKARAALLLAAVTLGLAPIVLAGCGSTDAGDTDVVMPRVVGLSLRSATELLAERGIRWRLAGTDEIHSVPIEMPAPDVSVDPSAGDDLVTGQEPAAGERITGGDIAELRTRCTDARDAGTPCY